MAHHLLVVFALGATFLFCFLVLAPRFILHRMFATHGIDLHYSSADFDPFAWRLTLSDVELIYHDEDLLTCPELVVRVGFVRTGLTVDISIDQPLLRITRTPSGELNLPKAAAQPAPALPSERHLIRSVTATNGQVRYRDNANGVQMDARGIELSVRSGSPYEISIASPRTRLSFQNHSVDTRWQMAAVLDDPPIVRRFEIKGGGVQVNMADQPLPRPLQKIELSGTIDIPPFVTTFLPQAVRGDRNEPRPQAEGNVGFQAVVDVPTKAVTLRVSAERIQIDSVELTRVRGETRVSTDGHASAAASAGIAGGSAAVRIAVAPGRNNATLTVKRVDPRRLPPLLTRLPIRPASAATGEVNLRWTRLALRNLGADGAVTLEPLTPAAAEDLSLGGHIDLAYGAGALKINPSQLQIAGNASVEFGGSIGKGSQGVGITTHVVDLHSLLLTLSRQRLGVPPPPASLEGGGSFEGVLHPDARGLDGRFQSGDLGIAGVPFTSISGQVRAVGRDVDLSEIHGELYGGTMTGHGHVSGSSYSISLTGESLRMHEIQPVFGSGTVGFAAHGEGSIATPSLSGQFVIDEAVTAFTHPESFAGDFAVQQRMLEVKVRSREHELQSTATIGLDPPYPLTASADFIDLPLMHSIHRYTTVKDIDASASGRVEAAIPLADRASSVVRVHLDDLRLRVGDANLRNRAPADVTFTPEYVDFESFDLEGEGHSLAVTGRLPLKEGREATLSVEGHLDLDTLELVAPAMDASGHIEGRATLRGIRPEVQGTGSFLVQEASLTHPLLPFPVRGVNGTIRLDGSDVNIEQLRGTLPEGSFSLDGVLPLSALPTGLSEAPATMDLRLALRSAGTGNIAHLLPKALQGQFHLAADADLRIGGRLTSLKEVTINGAVTNAQLDLFSRQLKAATFRVVKEGDLLTVRDVRFTGDGSTITGIGEIQMAEGDRRLHAEVDAVLENRAQKFEFPTAQFGGQTLAHATADGPLAAPHLAGKIDFQNASAKFPEKRIEVAAANGSLTFTENGAKVEVTSTVNGGSAELVGDMAFHGATLTQLQMDASMEGSGAFYPEGLKGRIDGRAALMKTADGLVLSGDFYLEGGEYKKSIGIERELLANVTRKEEKPAQPPLSWLAVDVNVSVVDQVQVRNNMADLRFRGDINVGGTIGKPRLFGHVETLEKGVFFFRGRRYSIQRGILDFEGDEGFDPLLDVHAQTEAVVPASNPALTGLSPDKHVITVEMSGKRSRPVLILDDQSPVQPLNETEIASLLLTGRLPGESGLLGKDDLRKQLAGFVGGSVGSAILPSVGRVLGIDQIDIQPNYISSQTDTPSARAIIGKDLGHGLFFTYAPDLSDSQRYLWILDLRMRHNVTLRATRQDDASYAGGFLHSIGFGGPSDRQLRRQTFRRAAPTGGPGRHVIGEITFDGMGTVDTELVKRQLTFKVGDDLDYARLSETQRRLYALNVFRTIRVSPEPMPDDPGTVAVRITLVPRDPYIFSYGLRYNTQGKVGAFSNRQNPAGSDGEFEIHDVNFLHRAVDIGLYTRQSRLERTYRSTVSLPYLFGQQLRTNVLLYKSHSEDPQGTSTFLLDKYGLTAQIDQKLSTRVTTQYFLKYDNLTLTEVDAVGHEPVLPVPVPRASIGTALIADFRDDRFNAKRGLFGSTTVEYRPERINETRRLLKSVSRLSFYYTLRGKLTFALNNRLGVINTFGNPLFNPDAFFAGGSMTVRSFDENSLGPYNPFGATPYEPWGGRAFVIYNQEARFPVRAFSKGIAVSGVVFHDAGNVFRETSRLRMFDVRHSLGLGVRVESPYSLFRLDYAWTIDPRPGESRSRLVFNIGQMF